MNCTRLGPGSCKLSKTGECPHLRNLAGLRMGFCTKLKMEVVPVFYSIDLERGALPCKSRWTGTKQHWAGAVYLQKICHLQPVSFWTEHRQSYWI